MSLIQFNQLNDVDIYYCFTIHIRHPQSLSYFGKLLLIQTQQYKRKYCPCHRLIKVTLSGKHRFAIFADELDIGAATNVDSLVVRQNVLNII